MLHRPEPVVPTAGAGLLPECNVLAVLPHDPEAAEAVVAGAAKAAEGDRHLVFLFQGDRPAERRQELMEVVDPYLRDRAAQVAFARAEGRTRKVTRHRHYVCIPGDLRREAVGDVWKGLTPHETLVMDGDQDVLPPIALDRVRRMNVDGLPVLRLVTGRLTEQRETG